MTITKILCPVEFSPVSEHAVAYALGLARQLGARVHLIHAWQIPVYAFPDGAVIVGPDAVTRITQELTTSLDALVARWADREVAVEGHLVEGYPDREIKRMAQELEADLIVMGTHARTGLPHFLLGSVAERVVRTAGIPVLTVPSPDED